MSKLFLFLLGLLLWGAAYATPASILQYKIEPTEEQKAEFFRKASMTRSYTLTIRCNVGNGRGMKMIGLIHTNQTANPMSHEK